MNALAAAGLAPSPIVWVALGSLVILLADAISSRLRVREITREGFAEDVNARWGVLYGLVSTGVLASTFIASFGLFSEGVSTLYPAHHSLLGIDPAASYAMMLLASIVLLSVWLSIPYLSAHRIHQGEVHTLLLLTTLGAFGSVCAVDLMSLYLSLELMSLPLYALAGSARYRLKSSEAGLKAFVSGAFASAIMLYGMALLYGATGSLDFASLRGSFVATDPLAAAGLSLLVAGVLFKIAAFPFHGWSPDVLEGAPTPISGLISTILPTSVIFILLRLFNHAIPLGFELVQPALAIVAIACMAVGSFMALVQDNVKRMLAYSGIAHTGFLLAGLAIGIPEARGAVVFYLTSFVFMNLGAYGVMAALAREGEEYERLVDFVGMGRFRPMLAAAMSFFLLALAGIPGTAGFMAKFAILHGTLDGDSAGLGAAIIFTSVVLFASYIKLPTLMYMRDRSGREGGATPIAAILALTCCVAIVLYLGVFPARGPFELDMLEIVKRVAN